MKTFSVGAIRDTNQEYGLLLPLVDHQMESLMMFLGLPLFWPYERLAYEVLMKDLDADPTMNAVEALGEVTARRRDAALASLVMVGFYLGYVCWKKTCSCSTCKIE